jgi:hypothetical protein
MRLFPSVFLRVGGFDSIRASVGCELSLSLESRPGTSHRPLSNGAIGESGVQLRQV